MARIQAALFAAMVAAGAAGLAQAGVVKIDIGGALNDNVPIIGYVTRLPASNGGRLRFISGWAVRNGAT